MSIPEARAERAKDAAERRDEWVRARSAEIRWHIISAFLLDDEMPEMIHA